MDGRTDILYFHSGDFSPWPAAAYAARNYELREWTFFSDLMSFSKNKSDTIFIYKKDKFILQWLIQKY